MDGCRCRECFGLAEYMTALTGQEYGIAAANGCAPLSAPATLRVACSGSMVCTCDDCEADRLKLMRERNQQAARQPWQLAA